MEDKLNTVFNGKKVDEFRLLYRASECKFDSEIFHNICDKYTNTLALIRTQPGLRIGGFTTQSWDGKNELKDDKYIFTFSLAMNNAYGIEENGGRYSIKCDIKNGPHFVHTQKGKKNFFFVKNNNKCKLKNEGTSGIPLAQGINETREIIDYEVYHIIFKDKE